MVVVAVITWWWPCLTRHSHTIAMPVFRSRAGENFRSRSKYEKYMRIWCESQKRTKVLSYFRALPRVVASPIELELRHDVVHNADDVLTKFRDFKRSGRWVSDTSASFFETAGEALRSTSLL
jgi:hypothetical protein